MIKNGKINIFSKRKSVYAYDPQLGVMIKGTSKNLSTKKKNGKLLCCASPIIITKSVKIGHVKEDFFINKFVNEEI